MDDYSWAVSVRCKMLSNRGHGYVIPTVLVHVALPTYSTSKSYIQYRAGRDTIPESELHQSVISPTESPLYDLREE